MPWTKYPNFIDGSYQAQAITVAADECINLYVELAGQHGKNDRFLTKTPGRKLLFSIPDPPVRGLFGGDGILYVAGYGTLFQVTVVNGQYHVSEVGTYLQASTPIRMVSNGNQLFFTSGDMGYCATTPTQLEEVVNGTMGTYLDTYFVAQQPNSNQFNISANDDGTSWDPLDFGTKEGAADRLVATFADHEQLWLIGEKTTEVWYDSGAALFPLQRIQGAFIEQGAIAPWSVQKVDNSLFWLGGDDRGINICWRMNGYLPVRISNHAVESQWGEYPVTYDAVAYSYQENGHAFYVLVFPSGNATWVYDCSTGLWHRRGTWNTQLTRYDADPCTSHAYVAGGGFDMHLVGDSRNGNVYQSSVNLYGDDANGGLLRWQRTAPHLDTFQKWNYFGRMRLEMLVGGNSPNQPLDTVRPAIPLTGEGPAIEAPEILMEVSDDGGFTWSQQLQGSLGKIGEYRKRVEWRQLGRSWDRVFRVYGSDPIQIALVDAYLDISPERP